MVKLVVVKNEKIPPGEKVTPFSIMPKVMFCYDQGVYKVFVGRTQVRVFKQLANAQKKLDKINVKERKKADHILQTLGFPVITQRKPILKLANTVVEQEVRIGFDNVV